MGRKIKYTDKERKELNKKRCKEYYAKNNEVIKQRRMQRYWSKKETTI